MSYINCLFKFYQIVLGLTENCVHQDCYTSFGDIGCRFAVALLSSLDALLRFINHSCCFSMDIVKLSIRAVEQL